MSGLLTRNGRPLRIMQMAFAHDDYIRILQKKNQRCTSHAQCMANYISDGYWAGHLLLPELTGLGYETFLCLPADLQSQGHWCRENNIGSLPRQALQQAICLYQVAVFQPDVLYVSHPHFFDDLFLEALPWAPSVIFGWSAGLTQSHVAWSKFDSILSTHDISMQRARECGARETTFALPGYPTRLVEELRRYPVRHDISFTGYWTPFHRYRNHLLHVLADYAVGKYDVAYYLPFFQGAPDMPKVVEDCNRGPLWGKSMFRSMVSSRITLNAHTELDYGPQSISPNMRQLEATGSGSVLLTQASANIEAFFTPGEHMVTFKDEQDMLNCVDALLADPERCKTIAAQGQAHCLRHYCMENRAKAFLRNVQRFLERASAPPADVLIRGLRALCAGLEKGRLEEEHRPLVERALETAVYGDETTQREVAACLFGFAQSAGLDSFMNWKLLRAQLLADKDPQEAMALCREELDRWPWNDPARHLLSTTILRLQAC